MKPEPIGVLSRAFLAEGNAVKPQGSRDRSWIQCGLGTPRGKGTADNFLYPSCRILSWQWPGLPGSKQRESVKNQGSEGVGTLWMSWGGSEAVNLSGNFS